MKNRFYILLAGLFLLTISVSAQSKKAAQILEELTKTTNAYDNIKVSFAYKMTNEEADIDESTNGTLLVSGDKYHLNIAGQEVITDGTTLWTYIPDSEEVQVNEVSEDGGFSPSKLLSSYSDEYHAKKEKDILRDGKYFYQLKLKPKDKESSFDYVILIINPDLMQLSDFIIHDFEGNIFTYELKQFITNSEISEDSFIFDSAKYP
ncbi:MAG: hypothetical protein GQ527_02860, partial [Bacteroidales bacterium]|nr:hypothetical protein [Bacteroidales bacterium]